MKRIIALMITALCLTAGAAAQEKPARVQKILPVKYGDPQRLANLLGVFGARINIDSAMKVIAVDGPADVVSALEEALKRLDVPTPAEKNIEFVFHILYAQPKGESEKLPAELEEVSKRIRSLFSYQSFSLLETAVIRTRDGRGGNASGAAADKLNKTAAGAGFVPNYSLRMTSTRLASGDKSPMIRIDELRFALRMPALSGKDKEGNPTWHYREAGFSTDLDVREGQKVVVGKAAMDASESAVILIVTARVVD